jgi:hypothetical protein
MLERGNHISVQDRKEVGNLLSKDFPAHPPEIVPNIKQAMVQPPDVVKQFSLREDRVRFLKCCLTQDLSFSLTLSVNHQIKMDAYAKMIYGSWCLTRIIHFKVIPTSSPPLKPHLHHKI